MNFKTKSKNKKQNARWESDKIAEPFIPIMGCSGASSPEGLERENKIDRAHENQKIPDISVLVGQTIIGILFNDKTRQSADEIIFTTLTPYNTIKKYMLFHRQDCCEDVVYHSHFGDDPEKLIGSVIIHAAHDETHTWPVDVPKDRFYNSFTWTYIRIDAKCASTTLR